MGLVCFSCGDDGHRINRCPQVNADFPFLPAGWSVNMDNGQYRATRMNKTLAEVPGNDQWSEREGQPLGPPEIKAPLTQVGSAAPWFLMGWTNEVEVEFMIDTGCQVTILATSVFEKMCAAHPQVRSRIRPCARRLVSAPLTVIGKIDLDVVFPVLQCSMCCVVASLGSDGLLGTEALQSCLPHQLDLRTGQLWAEGRSTLQLHQQKPTPDVRVLLLTAVVLPQTEVVAPFSLNGGQLGTCALIVPDRDLTV